MPTKPISPVKSELLGDIVPGSPTKLKSYDAFSKYYEKSKAATFIEGKSTDQLKGDVVSRLNKKMSSLNMKEWKTLQKEFGDKGISSKRLVDSLIRSWSMTSGGKNKISIAMQLAAKKEFGLQGTSSWWNKNALKGATAFFKTHEKATRKFLREMYNDTQKHLAKQGLKTVRVVRGVRGNVGIKLSTIKNPISSANIQLQPMSSFSGDWGIAHRFTVTGEGEQFASLIFAEVPANRILSCPVTGYGCKKEFEYVVLGSQKTKEKMLASVIRRGDDFPEDPSKAWDKLFSKPTPPKPEPLSDLWKVLPEPPKPGIE